MTKGERRRYEFRNWKQNKGLSDYRFFSSHYSHLIVIHKNSEYSRKLTDDSHELKNVQKITLRKHAPVTLYGPNAVHTWSEKEKFDSLEDMIETLFIVRLAKL